MKLLITCPNLKLLGGVANHYIGLRPYWNETVKYQQIGKRNNHNGSGKYWLLYDIIVFIKNLLLFRPDCILFNPSIGRSALRRDFLLQKFANKMGFKTAMFIHGFDISSFEKLDKDWLKTNLNKNTLIFVLAKDFRDRLESIGVTIPIVLSTTKVDNRLIDKFDISKKDGKTGDLLFLSRVEKAKGIYETLDTFKILKKSYPKIRLRIVGDGSELNDIIKKIEVDNIKDVIITGALEGSNVAKSYQNSLLLLLLSYGEGMPTTVLEAMAFGLPVITRPVGGLVDFFQDGIMGSMNETLDPKIIAESIQPYLDNKELTLKTARYNHQYAIEHFMASKVAKDIESQLSKHLSR